MLTINAAALLLAASLLCGTPARSEAPPGFPVIIKDPRPCCLVTGPGPKYPPSCQGDCNPEIKFAKDRWPKPNGPQHPFKDHTLAGGQPQEYCNPKYMICNTPEKLLAAKIDWCRVLGYPPEHCGH